MLYAREDGKWLIAVLREWPDEGVALRDLDWLIGTWEAKKEEGEVRTTYTWDANKNSIRCQISIKGKGRTVNAIQVLLKDPRNGQLRSWIFDDDGSFVDSAWTADGKRAGGLEYPDGIAVALRVQRQIRAGDEKRTTGGFVNARRQREPAELACPWISAAGA